MRARCSAGDVIACIVLIICVATVIALINRY